MSRTILITGASRGIGYETARTLAVNGNTVIITARSTDKLTKLEKEFPEDVHAQPGDLTSDQDIQKIAQFIDTQFDSLDILINNAGLLVNKSFENLTDSDWQRTLEVNLIANIKLTKMLLPQFADSGHIVNISSMGGYQGSAKFSGLTAYSVAKGGVSILTECLAEELVDQNISVNALCLGAVQTEMLEEAFPSIKAPVSPVQMGNYIAQFALEGSQFYNGRILPVALNNPE